MSEPAPRPTHWWSIELPPWWVYVLAIVADVGTACWRTVTTSGGVSGLFFGSLVWPGLIIAAIVMAVAWLGWGLDLG